MKIDRIIPLIPEPGPIYRVIVSLGTQTSKKPRSKKMDGITKSISLRLKYKTLRALASLGRSRKAIASKITSAIRKKRYLLDIMPG